VWRHAGKTTYQPVGYGVTSTSTPGFIAPIHYPKASIAIKTCRGAKPEGAPPTFDAHSVLKYAQ
jgi:hypothetical protein